MATEVLKDQKIFFDGYDLTGVMNALGLDYGVEAQDVTVFGNDTRINKGGLLTVAASLQGFFDADPYDAALQSNIGAAGKVLSFCQNGTLGNPAYTFQAMLGSYSPGGSAGEMFAFSLDAGATGKLVRGTLMENSTDEGTTGDGTGRQLGAVASGQSLYAALHVLGVDGTSPTLDLVIESDDNAGFTSATERIAFTQAAAIGGEWKSVAGAITDDYWRASWTIGGTDPAFDFVVILGII